MSEPGQIMLDFAKIAFGAFVTILNGWILWVMTEIKSDIRELRAAIYRDSTPAPRQSRPVEKETA